MKNFFTKNYYSKIFFIFLLSLFCLIIFQAQRVSAAPNDSSEWGVNLKAAPNTFDGWKAAYTSASATEQLKSWNIKNPNGSLVAPSKTKPLMVGIPSDKGETWFTLNSYQKGGLINTWQYYFVNNDYPHWFLVYDDSHSQCNAYYTSDTAPKGLARALVEGSGRFGDPGIAWCNFSNTGMREWLAENVKNGDTTTLDNMLGLTQNPISIPGEIADAATATLEEILLGNVKTIIQILGGLFNWIAKFFLWVLENILIVDVNQDGMVKAWVAVRNAANIMLIIGLLFIAFFNAIRFQIDYYTAKALIPRLAIAAVMVNFSFFISKAIIDFGNVLTNYFLTLTKFNNLLDWNLAASFTSGAATIAAAAATGIASILGMGFGAILSLIIAIALGVVVVILLFRIGLLMILTAMSPLVFLTGVLPFTRDLSKQWWNYMLRYSFMGAVIALILYIGSSI